MLTALLLDFTILVDAVFGSVCPPRPIPPPKALLAYGDAMIG
jgi:hypothetical protein